MLVELESSRRSSALEARTTRECDSRCSSRRNSAAEEEIAPFDESALPRALVKRNGIADDVSHVKELQSIYCTLTEEVKVLPCLLSRFTDDLCECEDWWTQIRTSDKLLW